MPIFAGQGREQLRRAYQEAWRKFQAGAPLEPLEAQIAAVVAEHPEYRMLIESGTAGLEAQFTPERGEQNPFLHMGLHLAIREQIATDRPHGISAVHAQLREKKGNVHDAEHAMLEILATTIWEAQRNGRAPDEQLYLERLRSLV